MDWHILKWVKSKDASGGFLIDCKLKSFILKLTILQEDLAWSIEVGARIILNCLSNEYCF